MKHPPRKSGQAMIDFNTPVCRQAGKGMIIWIKKISGNLCNSCQKIHSCIHGKNMNK